MRNLTPFERLLAAGDRSLRTLAAPPRASRPSPAAQVAESGLLEGERAEAAALMRVNHVGEVCAQALYDAQALATDDPALRTLFERAAAEETDHLAWTAQRIRELGGRVSLLNPLWYGGAFAIGFVAARVGDRSSLGFMAETERQVEAHLASHLSKLPAADRRSRSIVDQMKSDEAGHAEAAVGRGAPDLAWPVQLAMRLAAKVMTTTARHI
jgi:ubiquinone biosynthesis monooxygenase Coq7